MINIIIISIILLIIYLVIENGILVNTKYTLLNKKEYIKLLNEKGYDVDNKKIIKENSVKICQISDFHDANFFNKIGQIEKSIIKNKPDIILLTGDLVDARRFKLNHTRNLINKIAKYCNNIYYVTGNHEAVLLKKDKASVYKMLEEYNIKILKNEISSININGKIINIFGMEDYHFLIVPYYIKKGYEWLNKVKPKSIFSQIFSKDEFLELKNEITTKSILRMKEEYISNNEKGKENLENGINILLEHRPDCINEIRKDNNIQLTFSGHNHGGQFRLFNIGLYAPAAGFFSQFTSGINKSKDKQKLQYNVISRGIGNSRIKFRIFNPSEVIYVTI